jgi:hypothetical protein
VPGLDAHALELLSAFSTLGQFIVIGVTAAVAAVQLRHLRTSNELEAVLSVQRDFHSPSLQRALQFVQAELPGRLAEPSFRNELERIGFVDPQRHPEMEVCNWFNEIGSLVKNRLVAESAFLDLFSKLVVHYWTLLEPAIAILRRRRGDSQYENFEYLAVRSRQWQARNPEGLYPKGVPRIALADAYASVERGDGPAAPSP